MRKWGWRTSKEILEGLMGLVVGLRIGEGGREMGLVEVGGADEYRII